MNMYCQLGPSIVLDLAEGEANATTTDEVAPSERSLSPSSPRPASLDALAGLPEIKSERRADAELVAQAEARP
jgi:hypothetical protein